MPKFPLYQHSHTALFWPSIRVTPFLVSFRQIYRKEERNQAQNHHQTKYFASLFRSFVGYFPISAMFFRNFYPSSSEFNKIKTSPKRFLLLQSENPMRGSNVEFIIPGGILNTSLGTMESLKVFKQPQGQRQSLNVALQQVSCVSLPLTDRGKSEKVFCKTHN